MGGTEDRNARTRRPREGVELPRWFSYAAIFVITAFVLHAFLVVVSLATGIVSEDSLMTMAGPVTFIVEFGLAAVITWLIVRPRAGRAAPSDEELAKRDAALEDDARQRVRAIEQQYVDEQRLERLTAEVAQWRKARDLREYATQALTDLGDGDVATADGGSLREELQWALDHADKVDPLRARD
jgi:membrane protein implicated in regulation of membrane protease activity